MWETQGARPQLTWQRHCCSVGKSSRCDKARGKERSETPTSGVIMASQRESNVDYPIGMLARQRATNLNFQSNWTGMRIRARGDGKEIYSNL